MRSALAAFVAAALVAAIMVPAPARAQDADVRALVGQIDALKRDLRDLQRTVYGGKAPPAGAATGAAPSAGPAAEEAQARTARLEVRLGRLEDEMRSLTGRVEEVQHNIDVLAARLDTVVGDMEFRLGALERRLAAAPPAAQARAPQTSAPQTSAPQSSAAQSSAAQSSAPQTSAPRGTASTGGILGTLPASALPAGDEGGVITGPGAQPTAGGKTIAVPPAAVPAPPAAPALPPGTPREQYKYAYDLLRRQEFDEAQRALQAFIEAHPDDALTGNAYYWLGETYYVRGDYKDAIAYFARGYKAFPKSRKAPDNLLKLGMSLARLGRKDDACLTLAELDQRFPTASPSIRQRAIKERRRLGCP